MKAKSSGFGKTVATGALVGIAAALSSVAVLRMLGLELNPAVVGGVVGAIAGSTMSTVFQRKKDAAA